MKNTLTKLSQCAVLISALAFPYACFAQAQEVSDPTSHGKLDTLINSNDMTRKEMTRALINWEAAAKLNEYQYNQQLLFMAAPYSDEAVLAGKAAGASSVVQTSEAISRTVFSNTISGTRRSKSDLYSDFVRYLNGGGDHYVTQFNPSVVMGTPNLAAKEITAEDTMALIHNLTDPFPKFAYDLNTIKAGPQSELNQAGLSVDKQEDVARKLIENALIGVSTNALVDIIARRTPKDNDVNNKTIMQVMEEYQRFTDPQWYARMGAVSDTAILRELAHMQAYNAWVQYQQFKVAEQQLALLATMNAIMARMNSQMEELKSQMATYKPPEIPPAQ